MNSHKLGHLKKRAEFLAVAASGLKWVRPSLIVQFLPFSPEPEAAIPSPAVAYGLTASRRVGNAVIRNRAKRRLRALAEQLLQTPDIASGKYVLIARHTSTVSTPIDTLRADLAECLKHLARVAAKKAKESQ